MPEGKTSQQSDQAIQPTARAEFRVFGLDIIAALQPRLFNGRTVLLQARELPAETYLLSLRGEEANVKLRAGLLDIKLRTGLTPQGYEIYQPSGKLELPLAREALERVFALLQAPLPAAAPAICSAEQLVALARAEPGLRVVTVEKQRWGFSIDGVVCEYARVRFNGALLETACVESEDHEAMQRVIAELGLQQLLNTSYLRAARRVVGLP